MPVRPMGREQMWLLPPTLDELLPLDHSAMLKLTECVMPLSHSR